jgi:LasA protease
MIRRWVKLTWFSIAVFAFFTSSVACQAILPAMSVPVPDASSSTPSHSAPGNSTIQGKPLATPSLELIASPPAVELPADFGTPEPAGIPQASSAHATDTQIESAESWLLPDSEVVFGPSASDFSTADYLASTQGYLKDYREWLESSGWTSAAQVIQRVASENSINPRLLLSLLEWECQCVRYESQQGLDSGYVLGVDDYHRKSLYGQLSWAARSLAEGYYAWRSGQFLPDITASYYLQHITPDINPGTAALLVFFTRLKEYRSNGSNPVSLQEWEQAVDWQDGLPDLHFAMFGNPWERDRQTGSLIPGNLQQPVLELPFEPGRKWSFTSGPHPAWENAGALSALDFAPATSQPGCFPSSAWVTAVADGQVVRSEYGSVVLDLDEAGRTSSDGYEGSGWAVLYMHIAAEDRVPAGTRLHTGDFIGHPSCEGGPATGTHVHIARKYNGEWIAADSTVPFVLSGWTPHNGEKSYQGSLTKDGQTVISDFYGTALTLIVRPEVGSEAP